MNTTITPNQIALISKLANQRIETYKADFMSLIISMIIVCIPLLVAFGMWLGVKLLKAKVYKEFYTAVDDFKKNANAKHSALTSREKEIYNKEKEFNKNKYVVRYNYKKGDELKQETIFITCDYIDSSTMESVKRTNDRLKRWLRDETALEVVKVLTPKPISKLDTLDANDAFIYKQRENTEIEEIEETEEQAQYYPLQELKYA